MTKPRSLNEAALVEQLCKQFLLEVQASLSSAHDEATRSKANQDIMQLVRTYAATFSGQNPTYTPADGLEEKSVGATFRANGHTLQSGFQLYLEGTSKIFIITTQQHAAGELSDTHYQAFINDLLTKMVETFMGTEVKS